MTAAAPRRSPCPSVGPEDTAAPTASSGLFDGAAGAGAPAARRGVRAWPTACAPSWPSWRSSAEPSPERASAAAVRFDSGTVSAGSALPRSPFAEGTVSQYSSTAAVPGGAWQVCADAAAAGSDGEADGEQGGETKHPQEGTHGRPESLTRPIVWRPMADDEAERDAPGRAEAGLAFLATAAVVLIYSLRGASYDVVVRGEAGMLIWWALAAGFASGRLPRARLPWPSRTAMAGFALLAGWALLAFGWTDSDERTSVELARIVHHAGAVRARREPTAPPHRARGRRRPGRRRRRDRRRSPWSRGCGRRRS